MRGSGVFAELLQKRFKLAYRRLDFAGVDALDCSLFSHNPSQLSLL